MTGPSSPVRVANRGARPHDLDDADRRHHRRRHPPAHADTADPQWDCNPNVQTHGLDIGVCIDGHTAGPGDSVVPTLTSTQEIPVAISQNTAADPPVRAPEKGDVDRCHLIAGANPGSVDSLGGNGSEPSNLVPCWGQPANRPGMTTQEKAIYNYMVNTNESSPPSPAKK